MGTEPIDEKRRWRVVGWTVAILAIGGLAWTTFQFTRDVSRALDLGNASDRATTLARLISAALNCAPIGAVLCCGLVAGLAIVGISRGTISRRRER